MVFCLVCWFFWVSLGRFLDKSHDASQEIDNNLKMALCYSDMKWNSYQFKKFLGHLSIPIYIQSLEKVKNIL